MASIASGRPDDRRFARVHVDLPNEGDGDETRADGEPTNMVVAGDVPRSVGRDHRAAQPGCTA